MSETERASRLSERAALKAATKLSLTKAGGPAFVPFTRKSAAQLYRYGDPGTGDFVPLDIAMEMDRMAGDPVILSQLAASLGYRLVPVGSEPANSSLSGLVSRVIRETGDVSATIVDALADGELSPREKDDIRREIREAETVLTQVRRQLDGSMEE